MVLPKGSFFVHKMYEMKLSKQQPKSFRTSAAIYTYLLSHQSFHVPRTSNTNMGRISRRPASMSNIRTDFDKTLSDA